MVQGHQFMDVQAGFGACSINNTNNALLPCVVSACVISARSPCLIDFSSSPGIPGLTLPAGEAFDREQSSAELTGVAALCVWLHVVATRDI